MRYFLGPPLEQTDAVESPNYVEVVTPYPGGSFITYLVREEEDTYAVCACWEQVFDAMFKRLNDPSIGPVFASEGRKLWPGFFLAYDNAVDERYGDGAMVELVDPDDMNRKWFIAIKFRASSDTQIEEKGAAAMERVVDFSLQIGQELERELTFWEKTRLFAKGGAQGYRRGKELTGPWEKGLDWLRVITGQ